MNSVQCESTGLGNIQQKIKKTKLIKDKLVKLQQESHPYQLGTQPNNNSNNSNNRQTIQMNQK